MAGSRPSFARTSRMARILDLYCTFLKAVIAACLAVMVVLVFGNVVLRYGFNSGITISEELSRWLLVWLTFLGAIVAVREHAHLGVDSLVRMLPAPGQAHLLHHQLLPDAVCRLAAALGKLAPDHHQLRRSRAGDRSCRSASSTRRRDLRRLGRQSSFSTTCSGCLSGQASEADMVAVKESEEH